MPELPEVETVRRGLLPLLDGVRLAHVEVRRPDLRFPLPPDLAGRLTGRTVSGLRRRGKYLLWDLDDGTTLLLHLGMSGRIRILGPGTGPQAAPGLHDHLVFRTEAGTVLVFHDPRRFGIADHFDRADEPVHPRLAGLGIEPLGPNFDAAYLERVLDRRMAPVKAALLDQRVVAGLGNIYVCEALHRARISPRRRAVTGRRAARLVTAIQDVLAEAIAAGGSSLRDYARVDGALGYFQSRFRVYDRLGRPCQAPGCRAVVRRIVQSGRSTFYCPDCQR